MSKSYLIFNALDQIEVMADTLRCAARKNDHESLTDLQSLVLGVTPRIRELTRALSMAELDNADGNDSANALSAAVLGTDSEGSAD